MNREQKIALILGFAVILVVGVLVSDHWSRARELDLADATEGDGRVVEGAPYAVLSDPGDAVFTSLTANEPVRPAAEALPEPQPAPLEFVRIDQGGSGAGSPLDEALGGIADASPPAGQSQPSWLDRLSQAGERLAQGSGALPSAAKIEEPNTPTSSPPPFSSVPKATPDRLPEVERRHNVARNESLFAIAKKYYGDGNRWREIAKANPGRVGADGSVRHGVILVIPGTARDAGSPAPVEEGTGERPVARPTPASPTTYTVRKNDSLGEIAQRLLGSSRRMGEIVAANRGKIDDPDDIKVGMVLTIPAKL